ncbi:hypothetical protein U1839_24510, partial [Sphingomonas sp. RT2P30]
MDGFDDVLSQVDLRQNMSAIAEIEDAIGVGGAQGELAADKGFRAVDLAPFEAEPGVVKNLTDM